MTRTLQKVYTKHAPEARGPYSQAVVAEQFVFVSGQLPIDPKVGNIVDLTIEGQTKQVLNNIGAILQAAGLNFERVVRAEVFLKDINDFQKMNAIYAEWFKGEVKPARQTFQVGKLPMDALIEISCIAMK